MKFLFFLPVLAVALGSCGHSTAATDPRVVQLHELHQYVDSLQVADVEVKLKKFNYPTVTQSEMQAVKPLLAESAKNLAQLDAFDLSKAQSPGLQADQFAFLIKQESTVLGRIRSLQKLAIADAQKEASQSAVLNLVK